MELRSTSYALCVSTARMARISKPERYQKLAFLMPRPDLEKLGLKHRHVPGPTIGRSVVFDTRLILRKLPNSKLGSDKLEDRFVEPSLEKYMVEGPVFATATGLVPTQFANNPTSV
jgi:hypothetical protein